MLDGKQQQIFDERNRKLAAARETRARRRGETPSKSSAKPTPPADVSRSLDFADIRDQLRISDVLDLLGCKLPSVSGHQLRGPCPLHGSTRGTSRCFSANTDKQVFHCFKCGCHGNALDLWAKAQRLSPCDAALDLCQRLNLNSTFNPPNNRNREEEPVIQSLDPLAISANIKPSGAIQNQLTQISDSSVSR